MDTIKAMYNYKCGLARRGEKVATPAALVTPSPELIQRSSIMSTYVYFIEASEVGRVKIGIADDPKSRLAILQIGSPCALRLAATIECPDRSRAKDIELTLHSLFAPISLRGEWFSADMDTVLSTLQAAVAYSRLSPVINQAAETPNLDNGAYSLSSIPRAEMRRILASDPNTTNLTLDQLVDRYGGSRATWGRARQDEKTFSANGHSEEQS